MKMLGIIFWMILYLGVNGEGCGQTKRWIPAYYCFKQHDNSSQLEYESCERQNRQPVECVLETMEKVHKKVVGFILPQDKRHIHVYEPAYVETPRGTSVVCLIPKVGSTPWKQVALKAKYSYSPDNTYSTWFDNIPRINALKAQNPSKAMEVLNDSTIPRWVIVRNPYSRVHSVYRNKYVITSGSLHLFHRLLNLKVKKNETTSFREFVKGLYDTYYDPITKSRRSLQSFKTEGKLDYHLALQTSLCGIEQGFEYDYVLKHELIADWYPRLIKTLNYTDVVMSGWPGENECFMSTPKMPCNGPSAEVITQGSKDRKTKFLHSFGSNAQLVEAYDEETAAMVTEMFYEDFFSLSYPTWDGRPETFRLTF